MVFTPRTEPLAAIPSGMAELFLCPAYKAKLSRHSCGKRHISANTPDADCGVTDRLHYCVGCEIGAVHAKDKTAPDVSLERVVRAVVPPKPEAVLPVARKEEPVTKPQKYMYEGEMRTLAEIAALKGMRTDALYVRIARWGEKRAFETPKGGPNGQGARVPHGESMGKHEGGPKGGEYKRAPRKTPSGNTYLFRGEQKTISQIAVVLGVAYETLRIRIKKWGEEKAFALPRGTHHTTFDLTDKHMRGTRALESVAPKSGRGEMPAVAPVLPAREPDAAVVEDIKKSIVREQDHPMPPEEWADIQRDAAELKKRSVKDVAVELLKASGVEVYATVDTTQGYAIFIR